MKINFRFFKDLPKGKSLTTVDSSIPLKRKLSEVLSEGLLDSVLPYLVQNASQPNSRRSSVAKLPTGWLFLLLKN